MIKKGKVMERIKQSGEVGKRMLIFKDRLEMSYSDNTEGSGLAILTTLSNVANLRLMASRAAGNITHAVFPLHLSTVGHFYLQA